MNPETVNNMITVAAVLIAPVLAVWINGHLDRRRERRNRRRGIFNTLMTTRAVNLSYAHVDALNQIDLEFAERGDEPVLQAWRAYRDHLGDQSLGSERWEEKTTELLVDLLHRMGGRVGADFDRTHIKRAAYVPRGYGDRESDQTTIRRGLVALLKGELSVPIQITSMTMSDEEQRDQAEVRRGLIEMLSGRRPLHVANELVQQAHDLERYQLAMHELVAMKSDVINCPGLLETHFAPIPYYDTAKPLGQSDVHFMTLCKVWYRIEFLWSHRDALPGGEAGDAWTTIHRTLLQYLTIPAVRAVFYHHIRTDRSHSNEFIKAYEEWVGKSAEDFDRDRMIDTLIAELRRRE